MRIARREPSNDATVLGLPAGVKPGSPVRLIDRVFAVYRGVLERVADDRGVTVLLNLLHREVRVFVPVASIGTA